MKRRESEAIQAAMARRHQDMDAASDGDDDRPVRQRAVADSGDDPAYEEYEKLAAAANAPTRPGLALPEPVSAALPVPVSAALPPPVTEAPQMPVSTAAAPPPGLDLHRIDGTPLDFSSREAKQEALRQHALEQIYEAEQASWGLPTPTPAGAAATISVGAVGSLPLPPRGRGRQMVRPAWLVRQEREQRGAP